MLTSLDLSVEVRLTRKVSAIQKTRNTRSANDNAYTADTYSHATVPQHQLQLAGFNTCTKTGESMAMPDSRQLESWNTSPIGLGATEINFSKNQASEVGRNGLVKELSHNL
jgi:hypothetical protein